MQKLLCLGSVPLLVDRRGNDTKGNAARIGQVVRCGTCATLKEARPMLLPTPTPSRNSFTSTGFLEATISGLHIS